MDIFNSISRWLGSKASQRTEMHHCFEHWLPKSEKKSGYKLTYKALSMTGLGFGLSPTTTHPEGGMFGFIKYLPNSSSVSSDGMNNHTFPMVQIATDESKYPYQVAGPPPPPPPPPPTMSGHVQNHHNHVYKGQPSCFIKQVQPFPLLTQNCKAFSNGQPSFTHRMYHPAMPTGQMMGQDRPYIQFVGQSFTQAPEFASKEPPIMPSWNGYQTRNNNIQTRNNNIPIATMNCHSVEPPQNIGPCQWTNMYPHNMQLPRQPTYQQNVMPQVRPYVGNLPQPQSQPRPQYCPPPPRPPPPVKYPPVQVPQVPQPSSRVPPVGTPYVISQTGSSPFISITPLHSVQVLCPAYLLAGLQNTEPIQEPPPIPIHEIHLPIQESSLPIQEGTVPIQKQGPICAPPAPQGKTAPGTHFKSDPTETCKVKEETPTTAEIEVSEASLIEDEVDGSRPGHLENSVSEIEESKFSSPEETLLKSEEEEEVNKNSNCDTPQENLTDSVTTAPAQEEPQEISTPENQAKDQNRCRSTKPKTHNSTPGPRKKKKCRPSAEKRRSKRTPTQCILFGKTPKVPEGETNKKDNIETKAENTPPNGLAQCMSTTVAFVLGLDDSNSPEPSNPTVSATFLGRCTFSISPSDSDSDLDNFFDEEGSDIEKCDAMPEDVDCFDFFSNPHNPLNFAHLVEPMKKSSSAPQLQYLDESMIQSSLDCGSMTDKKRLNSRKRQVKFASDEALVTVHLMEDDLVASQEARKGHWELYAIDRFRFKNRINEIDNKISYIFDDKHREAIREKLQLQ